MSGHEEEWRPFEPVRITVKETSNVERDGGVCKEFMVSGAHTSLLSVVCAALHKDPDVMFVATREEPTESSISMCVEIRPDSKRAVYETIDDAVLRVIYEMNSIRCKVTKI